MLTGAIDQGGGELREQSVFRGGAAPCELQSRRWLPIWEHSRLSRMISTANSIKDTKPVS